MNGSSNKVSISYTIYMKRKLIFSSLLFLSATANAQGPAITSWLQNNSTMGTYYVAGNSTAIPNNILVNCQSVEYSANSVYIKTKGIPAYPTGPFLDGNPSIASDQNEIIKLPLYPTPNTGTLQNTVGGNIGVFINGVALFDFRDGVGWNTTTNTLCGGPGNPPCPGGPMSSTPWSRDAVPAEKPGFDCSKGHPAMGNYHHHQNPSAFKLDLTVISTICNLYDADGLYGIDSTMHSPLIGYAFDGYPIYGAYGYANADGTGGIKRIQSGYQLRNITDRTVWADGTDVADGPAVSATYFLGYFREDYEWLSHPTEDYLDMHNGRFCVTPEYPNGTYCYFATVDENWNSAYPYVVGPTFYGNFANRLVTTIAEPTTPYAGTAGLSAINLEDMNISIFPNPATDLLAIQINGLVKEDVSIDLMDLSGRMIESKKINKGQTICYFDVQTIYSGTYIVKISNSNQNLTRKVVITR